MINRMLSFSIWKKRFCGHHFRCSCKILRFVNARLLNDRLLFVSTLIFTLVSISSTFSQVDDFSKEEADYFRAQKIYPLVSREQDGDYARSVYLIPHDITVPKGKVMTLYPGSTFLFKKDTRLIVHGKLISKGNDLNPVLFCKLDNKDYYTPVDSMVDTKWDGIFISDSGMVELQYTHLSDSKYGLVAEDPLGEIILDSVQFYNNRYQNLKIGTKEIPVKEASNVFYQFTSFSKPVLSTTISNPIDTYPKPQLVVKPQKPATSPKLRSFRVVTTIGMILGAAAGGGGHYLYKKHYPKYNAIKIPTRFVSDDDLEEIVKKAHLHHMMSLSGEKLRIGGISVAGLCLTGFVITLLY